MWQFRCCVVAIPNLQKKKWKEEGLTPILYTKFLYNFAQEMFSKLQLFITKLVFWIYYTNLEILRKQIQWADDLHSDFNSFLTGSCLWFKLKNDINCQCCQMCSVEHQVQKMFFGKNERKEVFLFLFCFPL